MLLIPFSAMNPPIRTMPRPPRLLCSAALIAACMATASTSALAAVDATQARELAQKNACLACHSVSSRVVGPSYKEVAARYAKDPTMDAAALAARIRSGGKGHWGTMEMPPQPNLSEADARTLAEWILADPSK